MLGLHLVVISSISIKFIVRFCLKHHLYNFSLHQVDIIYVNISMQTCFPVTIQNCTNTRRQRKRENREEGKKRCHTQKGRKKERKGKMEKCDVAERAGSRGGGVEQDIYR